MRRWHKRIGVIVAVMALFRGLMFSPRGAKDHSPGRKPRVLVTNLRKPPNGGERGERIPLSLPSGGLSNIFIRRLASGLGDLDASDAQIEALAASGGHHQHLTAIRQRRFHDLA